MGGPERVRGAAAVLVIHNVPTLRRARHPRRARPAPSRCCRRTPRTAARASPGSRPGAEDLGPVAAHPGHSNLTRPVLPWRRRSARDLAGLGVLAQITAARCTRRARAVAPHRHVRLGRIRCIDGDGYHASDWGAVAANWGQRRRKAWGRTTTPLSSPSSRHQEHTVAWIEQAWQACVVSLCVRVRVRSVDEHQLQHYHRCR